MNEKHVARMKEICFRLEAIDIERHRLADEKRALEQEVANALGVTVGSVHTIRNESFKVLGATGMFYYDPFRNGENMAIACAYTTSAPATKNGFHSRVRVQRTVFDKPEHKFSIKD